MLRGGIHDQYGYKPTLRVYVRSSIEEEFTVSARNAHAKLGGGLPIPEQATRRVKPERPRRCLWIHICAVSCVSLILLIAPTISQTGNIGGKKW